MLKKETILKSFNEDDAKEAIKIYEKYKLAYEKDITVFTSSFYSPNIWSFLKIVVVIMKLCLKQMVSLKKVKEE